MEARPRLSQSYPMCGGYGPHSYARNSSYQKAAIDGAKETIKEFIRTKLDFKSFCLNPTSNVISIGDFGCSVGPNTFTAVENIIEAIELRYREENHQKQKTLEFLVFFNDQADNDFNTLFKTLPPTRKFFPAAAPGSFYGRLLPKGSIHLGHTSYTLHWLSKPPTELADKTSPAWNKDSIQCTGLVKEVNEAYLAQFRSDMEAFLDARAQEIVPGGLMMILGQCLPDGVLMARIWKGVVIDIIGSCLADLANSGLISREKVESFNLPVYFPRISELKDVIEKNGHFSIETLKEVSHPMENMPLSNQFITSSFRAIFNGVIKVHFGDNILDELFDYLSKKLEKDPPDFKGCDKDMQYFVLLRRDFY